MEETDRLGRTTVMTYDALNRLTETRTPDGSTHTTEYDAAGRVIAEVDALGQRTRYQYDAAGRRTAVINALEQRHSFEYDANGNLVMETDANGHETRYTYNSLDQKVSTRFHDGSTVSDEYDALSRKTASIDQNGTRTEYDYDALGRLTAVRQFLNGAPLTTHYSYDSQGNKLTQTDAEGRTTRWEYDALGRVTARILPLGQRETFEYDANGNQTRHTDFNGQLTTSEYDALNRLVRRSYADGTQEAWTYDAAGRVIETTLTTNGLPQVTHYQYDQRDRLTRETKPDGSVLEYSYDLNGNKTSVTATPAGGSPRPVNYSYDALNRLATATDEHGTTTYTYTPAGSRASVTQANGVITSYNYDSLNRLTQLTSRASNGTVLQQYSYTLDATGRRTRIIEHNGRASEYRYDDLYRLVEEAITDPQNGNHLAQYQYDTVGNRTQSTVNGVTTSYSYDANDRILSQGGTSYTYDANGNTLAEASSSGTTSYSWDARNRLTEATTPNGSLLFGYDINGIRTSRSEGGITTNYVVDHNQQYAQVLAETEGGATTKQYTYGDDLLSQTEGAGQERFFLYDGLGTTRALADGAEAVTDTYAYEAFGELLASTGSSDNTYRYTGEQYDSGLDQYYLRARYYNQGVGRFTQMDTWMGRNQDPITLHKYLYANADPVRYVDPSGNFSIGNISVTINVQANLSTLSLAANAYSVFQVATGDQELSAAQMGMSILLSRMPGGAFARRMAEKFRAKTGRNLLIPCLRNSFPAGTLVHTESGLVAIEDVKIGDMVLSFNEETGESEYQKVIHLIRGEGEYALVEVDLDDGESITATEDHPFYVNGEWLDAGAILRDDALSSIKGLQKVADYSGFNEYQKVYNLTVENTHTYYVGRVGVLVHNANRDCVLSVRNMDEFFSTPFGAGIKAVSARTGKTIKGAQLFRVGKRNAGLSKGQYFYLDTKHGDHLEVFDKNGYFLRVLNLDGTENAAKTAAAAGRSIKKYL